MRFHFASVLDSLLSVVLLLCTLRVGPGPVKSCLSVRLTDFQQSCILWGANIHLNFLFLTFVFAGNQFWYNLQISFDTNWSCKGQIKTHIIPTSHPSYVRCSSVDRDGPRCKNIREALTA